MIGKLYQPPPVVWSKPSSNGAGGGAATKAPPREPTPATSFRFDFQIDGMEIGSFTACEGLAAEYEIRDYPEGGQNGFVHRLPGRLKYPNVRLSRAVDGPFAGSSGQLAAWFSSLKDWADRSRTVRTASVTAFDPAGRVIARWNLVDAIVVKWTGPSFSAEQSTALKETLEIAHHGFMA